MNTKRVLSPTKYKKTDLGEIPTEWSVEPLTQIVDKFIDYRGVTPKKLGFEWGDGNIRALSANNVQMGYIDYEKECYFASEELYKRWMRNGNCLQGDVLLTMEAPLGNVASIPDDRKYILSQRAILIRPIENVQNGYLKFFMMGNYFQQEMFKNASGSTAQGIQRKKLEKILCCYPTSFTEQKAITQALSDIDSLITKLTKLIQKKRNIKQGAMQELLTGKRRLPGFSGEWMNFLLEKYANFTKGKGLPKSAIVREGKRECIHYGELFTDYSTKIDTVFSRTSESSDLVSQTNDVLMPTSDVTPNGLAKASCIPKHGVVLGGDILIIRPNSEVDGVFLSYQIRQQKSQIMSLVSGTTVFHLYASDMKRFVYLSPKIDEQTAIVQVLEDMGAEIEALEKQKTKYIYIKQGMMQQLLTGQIRLTN